MLFSIICPAHNTQCYISDCIRSVKNQNFNDWELIIVNDESTDDTVNEVSKFLSDKRIKLFSVKHGGQTRARKFGLDNCCGEYILFLDSDDCLDKNALWFLASIIKKQPYDIISFGMVKFSDKKEIENFKQSNLEFSTFFDEKVMEYYYGRTKTFSMCGNAIKKEKVINGFNNIPSKLLNLRVCEDSIAISEIISLCSSAYVCNQIFYYYFQNPDSVSHIDKNSDVMDVALAFNHLYDKYTSKGKKIVYINEEIKKQISLVPIFCVLKSKEKKYKTFCFARKLFIFKHFTINQGWESLTHKCLVFSMRFHFFLLFLVLNKIYWNRNKI